MKVKVLSLKIILLKLSHSNLLLRNRTVKKEIMLHYSKVTLDYLLKVTSR